MHKYERRNLRPNLSPKTAFCLILSNKKRFIGLKNGFGVTSFIGLAPVDDTTSTVSVLKLKISETEPVVQWFPTFFRLGSTY
jgi:hypothetical protein